MLEFEEVLIIIIASKRRGALALEFLFTFLFILFCFLFLFAFESIIIIRANEAYTVWRIDRVSSIITWDKTVKVRSANDLVQTESSSKITMQDLTELKTYINKLGFGDYSVQLLENQFNLKVVNPVQNNESKVENDNAIDVTIQYNKTLENLLRVNAENFYWNCPSQPPEVNEHDINVFGG